MQPAANGVDGVKLINGEVDNSVRITEAAFLRQKRSDISVDQVSLRFHPSRSCLTALH